MKYLIREAKESDLEQVHRLLKETIYFSMEHTKDISLGMINSIAYVAEINKEIIGFSNIIPIQSDIYLSKCTAIHKNYRHRGIGTKLMESKINAISRGIIASISWVSPNPEQNSERLLMKLGFVEISNVLSYYAADCKSINFCEYHVNGKCECGAKVFVKHKF